MGDGFVKIYGDKLLRSSLWLECWQARLVFTGMLAAADEDGRVDHPSIRVLARLLNLDVEDVERGLAVLEAPDPDSHNPAEEGRRVVRDASGWRIVSYRYYREYRTKSQQRAAERVKKHRSKAAASPELQALHVTPETPEAEAEAEAEREGECPRADTRARGSRAKTLSTSAQEPGERADRARMPAESARTVRSYPESDERFASLPGTATPQQTASEGITSREAALANARSLVRVAFARKFEAAEGSMWTRAGDPSVDTLASWLVSVPGAPEEILSVTLDNFFKDPWCRSKHFPISHLARYPQKYFEPRAEPAQKTPEPETPKRKYVDPGF